MLGGAGTELDDHLLRLEAPRGVGSARSGETTGWKQVPPALPPSGLEGRRFKNSKLRFGLPGHYEGLLVSKGDTTFNLIAQQLNRFKVF